MYLAFPLRRLSLFVNHAVNAFRIFISAISRYLWFDLYQAVNIAAGHTTATGQHLPADMCFGTCAVLDRDSEETEKEREGLTIGESATSTKSTFCFFPLTHKINGMLT